MSTNVTRQQVKKVRLTECGASQFVSLYIFSMEASMEELSKALASNGFIQVNKTLIKNLGLHEAVMIGELCAEYNYYERNGKLDNGAFYSTRSNIEENTGLTEHHQRNAIETLVEKGLLEIVKKGMPAVNYYKINFDALLLQLSEAQTTSASSRRQQVVEGADINNNKETIIRNKNTDIHSTIVECTAEDGCNHSRKNSSLLPDIIFEKPKKSKKANLYEKCEAYIMQFTNNIIMQEKLKEYLVARLEIAKAKNKPFYYTMWPPIVNELNILADNADTMLKIINQSISKGWEKFYPLKTYENGSSMKYQASESAVSTNKNAVTNLSEISF